MKGIVVIDISLSERIYNQALKCGFDNCGIISINEMDDFSKLLQLRYDNVPFSKRFYGSVKGYDSLKDRFPFGKSVIICIYWYGKYRYPEELRNRYAKDFFLMPEENTDSEQGYNLNRFENYLKEEGVSFTGGKALGQYSIGSLRHAAVKAGMGIIRKNNFFYTENGSHNLLVGYVIDKECEKLHSNIFTKCSDNCNLCINSCKTGALCGAYTMNPFNCVSFWTTFGKGTVPDHLSPEMFEEWICGCDNCQDACPHNHRVDWNSGEDFSNLKDIAERLKPENIINESDEFIEKEVITKTDNHLEQGDSIVIRNNALRALEYSKMKQE